MPLAVSERELQDILATTALTRNYGFILHSIGEGECTIRVPFREDCERPGGVVSGQVCMAAADVALWLAIKTRLGSADQSVTAEMKTNFLSGARNEEFLCSARILKLGNRLIYGTAECRTPSGQLLTHSTITYIRVEPR